MDDEIGQGPDRGNGLPPRTLTWLTAVAIGGLVAAGVVFAVTRGGQRSAGASPVSQPTANVRTLTARPVPVTATPSVRLVPVTATPAAAPGTVLLGCDSAIWAEDPGWQAGSLRVGSLWLVHGSQQGYVRLGRLGHAGQPARPGGAPTRAPRAPQAFQLLMHVDAGSAVVLRIAAGSSAGFQFADDPGGGSYQSLGDKGFTLVPCPRADTASGSLTDFFDVGYSLAPGAAASVEVWTTPSARPVWLSFTAPKEGTS